MLPIFWAEKLTLDLSAPYYGWSPTPSGATAIEYALIAALVSVGAVVALNSMGTSLNQLFRGAALRLIYSWLHMVARPGIAKNVRCDSEIFRG